MALKAGTVGIDPKYVDKNGKPVSDVDLSNYYTKTETDGKLDNKANLSYITANNKKFQFAYDSESGKYGYKAGAQDDFHPFESAGAPGWNKPADLITTGLTYTHCSYIDGGYYVDEDNDIIIVDIIVKGQSENYTCTISGFPASNEIYVGRNACFNADLTKASKYIADSVENQSSFGGTKGNPINVSSYAKRDWYWHLWLEYPIYHAS